MGLDDSDVRVLEAAVVLALEDLGLIEHLRLGEALRVEGAARGGLRVRARFHERVEPGATKMGRDKKR